MEKAKTIIFLDILVCSSRIFRVVWLVAKPLNKSDS